jgi:hypothetical protein
MPMNLYRHPAELGPPVLDSVLAPSTPPEMNIVIPEIGTFVVCVALWIWFTNSAFAPLKVMGSGKKH